MWTPALNLQTTTFRQCGGEILSEDASDGFR